MAVEGVGMKEEGEKTDKSEPRLTFVLYKTIPSINLYEALIAAYRADCVTTFAGFEITDVKTTATKTHNVGVT